MKLKNIFYLSLTVLVLSCGNRDKTGTLKQEETTENTQENGNEKKFESVTGVVPPSGNETANVSSDKIEWLDFETAIDRNQKNKKYIFIDIYTDWCGWCKKMDASTFVHPEVVTYLNENCYSVKMNAESKDPIPYKGVLYESKLYGNKEYNSLAHSLLDAKMSFPSFVVLNKKEVKAGKIIGYKDAPSFLTAIQGIVK